MEIIIRAKFYLFVSTLDAVNTVLGIRKASFPELSVRQMYGSVMKSTLRGPGVIVFPGCPLLYLTPCRR